MDTFGDVYIYGLTFSISDIATTGAYQTNGGNGDAFLAKFFIPPCSLDLSLAGKDTLCLNAIESYSTTATFSNTYEWRAIGGSVLTGKNKDTVKIQWKKTGDDTLWLIGSSGSCKDSIYKIIVVNPLPDAHFSATEKSGTTYKFAAYDKTQSIYKWMFGDGKTGKGDTITHSYLVDSTYKISLDVTNSFGCTSAFDSTLSVLTGIQPNPASIVKLQIYPNPFTNVTNIEYTLQNASNIQASIADINGNLIAMLKDEKQEPGNYNLQFDAIKYNCSSGVYYLKIVVDNELITNRIVKIN